MKVMENSAVNLMMNRYLALLKNDDYQKIEKFVEDNGGLTSKNIKLTGQAISAMRRFVDINLANENADHEKANWRGINSIANLASNGNAIVVKNAPNGTKPSELFGDWETWADKSLPASVSENTIGVNAEVVSIWFFNNAAKYYNEFRQVLTLMASATESKSVFSELEQTNRANLKQWASALLPPAPAKNAQGNPPSSGGNVLSQLGSAINDLCPQTLNSDKYEVLRYTYSRFRSWGKTASRADLIQLKQSINTASTPDSANGNWIGAQYVSLFLNQFAHVEQELLVANETQVQLLGNNALMASAMLPNKVVNVNLNGKGKDTSVYLEVRDLTLLKSALENLNNSALNLMIEWQYRSEISGAEAKLAQASIQLVFNTAAGITSFFSEEASNAIALIGKAQDELFQAKSAYPAAIEAAQIRQLKDQHDRILSYLDMIIGNYQLMDSFAARVPTTA